MNQINLTELVAELYTPGFERTKPVTTIVDHGTAGGGTRRWVMDAHRNAESAQYRNYCRGIALFHFLIEPDGTVVKLIDPQRWVYHASIGGLDAGTIGIEWQNGDPANRAPYTPEQYAAGAELYAEMLELFPSLNRRVGHGQMKKLVSGGWKECPGPGFDWEILRAEMRQRGFASIHEPTFQGLTGIKKTGG